MRLPIVALMVAVAVFTSLHTNAAERDPIPLGVLYLSRSNDDQRTAAFSEFLSERFQHCVVKDREDYTPELLAGIDVVLFDWSQGERTSSEAETSLGTLEEWSKPIVLLGSAGLLMAEAWQVIGDAG